MEGPKFVLAPLSLSLSLLNKAADTLSKTPYHVPMKYLLRTPLIGRLAPVLTRRISGFRGDNLVKSDKTETAYVFRLQLPQLRKEQLKVEIDDGAMLCLRCDRTEVENKEIRVALAEDVEASDSTATMNGDVLTVTVPKRRWYNFWTGQLTGRISVAICS